MSDSKEIITYDWWESLLQQECPEFVESLFIRPLRELVIQYLGHRRPNNRWDTMFVQDHATFSLNMTPRSCEETGWRVFRRPAGAVTPSLTHTPRAATCTLHSVLVAEYDCFQMSNRMIITVDPPFTARYELSFWNRITNHVEFFLTQSHFTRWATNGRSSEVQSLVVRSSIAQIQDIQPITCGPAPHARDNHNCPWAARLIELEFLDPHPNSAGFLSLQVTIHFVSTVETVKRSIFRVLLEGQQRWQDLYLVIDRNLAIFPTTFQFQYFL